jgi:8-oxo-dGTP diphosphatase
MAASRYASLRIRVYWSPAGARQYTAAPGGGMGAERERSVTAVVVDPARRRVLLHLRGDVWLWSLPGGGVEPGESWEGAAIREVREETGYEIVLDRLVGEYQRPQLGDTKRCFAGHVVGGAARVRPPETIRVAWHPLDRLPPNRLPLHREYVVDTLADWPAPVRKVQRQSRRTQLALRLVYGLADLLARLRRWVVPRPG